MRGYLVYGVSFLSSSLHRPFLVVDFIHVSLEAAPIPTPAKKAVARIGAAHTFVKGALRGFGTDHRFCDGTHSITVYGGALVPFIKHGHLRPFPCTVGEMFPYPWA